MPEISRFFGMVMVMFYRDHSPPHFHAYYGDYQVTIGIEDGKVVGEIPARALRLIDEWRTLHQGELLENWSRMEAGEPLKGIQPLE